MSKYTCKKESGRFVLPLLFLIVVIAVALSALYYMFGEVIGPGYMGVRQIAMGPGQGYSARGLRPGYHWTIPFYSRIHLFPSTLQVTNFHSHPGAEDAPALDIKTSDGADVAVDITVFSRFYTDPAEGSEKHGGPADLIKNVGSSPERWRNQIMGVASDELKRGLSGLFAGEFYNPHKRDEAIKTAHKGMNDRLEPFGIHIEAVLLRRYTYRDFRIDDAIFNKNLQDQERNLKTVSGALAEAHAELEKEAARWDADIATLKVKGENQVRILRSEGELVQSQKESEADLKVARAQAEVDRLRAQALAKSMGGVYVAREIAPILESLRGGVVSGIDPYDVKAWADKLGAEGK